jgi:hypothetical protein
MEEFSLFLTSDIGKMLAIALLLVGVSDVAIARFILGKKVAVIEESLSPTLSPAELQPYKIRIKGLKVSMGALQTTGVAFILFGIYILAR